MKKMKKILSFLLAFTMAFSCLSGIAYAAVPEISKETRPADGVTEGQPFAPGTGGSNNFRIPCLVTLDDGTIVAACDARWNHSSDACGLDTIVSRSTDGGKTWSYTFANYLGDNGNKFDFNSTAFIDPAIATDGETIWMIADIYPAGVAINTVPQSMNARPGHTGYDENHNLVLAKATDSVHGLSETNDRIAQSFEYTLVKIEGAKDTDASFYNIIDKDGNVVEGYTIDAFFNIKGEGVDTNLFIGDSPYFPWPTDFLYMTKSTDGGATWSIPTLIDLKKAEEQTLLVGPGRGIVVNMPNGKERIIFTAYDFTNVDDKSSAIYSDDGGKTWTRGADVANWSSESVVTEADGRLYVFTRHGNCYYVSEDGGETWGPAVSVPKPYNSNCQLTAITYSEKIDGKTAILFAVPSNTSSRSAGKIYVALVQEDGSLDWAYEYSINGAAYYAYSCMDELANGDIALLYESAGAAITYTDIAIEDIVQDAAIGNIWLTNEGDPVGAYEMKPNATMTFTLEGLKVRGAVVAESSKPDAATVSVDGNQVTVQTGNVEGLAEVDITVTAGEDSTTLKLTVTAAEQYELVKLHMGQRAVYQDKTGDYSDADLSGVDKNVATVTLTGESFEEANAGEKAQLATAVGNFGGDVIDLEDCLYTFTGTGTANQYVISGTTADGQTAYLNLTSGGQTPNQTGAVNVDVLVGSEADQTFKLYDTTQRAHLHFWYDDTAKLHFDRCGTSCGVRDYVELYTASESAPADSPIAGYKRVASQSEITSGGQYLIARTGTDGNVYVMRPMLNGSNYQYVAKYVKGAQVQLATENANFNGSIVGIDECLYTFTGTGTANQYEISATANGTTVYLNPRTSDSRANTTTKAAINVAKNDTEAKFSLYDTTSSNNGGYLYFWKDDIAKLYYDRNGSIHTNCWFEIFEKSADAVVSEIPGYQKVENLNEIVDGGQYLIAMLGDDGYYYFLHPSKTTDRYSHVARTLPVDISALNGNTEILIEAVGEGETSVVVGDTTYFIHVANEVKETTLEIGESFVLPGTVQKYDEEQTVVSKKDLTGIAPYVPVSEVTENGKYLIGCGSFIMMTSPSTTLQSPSGMGMEPANYEKGNHSENLWTITKVTDGFTIQDANEKYLTINGQNVSLADSEQVLTIQESDEGGLTVTRKNGSTTYYLNNWARGNNHVAAYHTDDFAWTFYQPSTGIEITAVEEGTTMITVGGVNYNITVKGEEEPTPVTTIFDDVADTDWFADEVQYVFDRGIMTGTGKTTFEPNLGVTRATIIQTLYKLEGKPTVSDFKKYNSLKDTPDDIWWREALAWALNEGVAKGDTTNNVFNPNNEVTREDLATFIYRYAQYKNIDVELEKTADEILGDTYVNSWAKTAFAWAIETGLIKGKTINGVSVLAPQEGATRAELATIMMRFYEKNDL